MDQLDRDNAFIDALNRLLLDHGADFKLPRGAVLPVTIGGESVGLDLGYVLHFRVLPEADQRPAADWEGTAEEIAATRELPAGQQRQEAA